MKVLVIVGTRPEAIKMCPVIKELEKYKEIQTVVCLTGQHKEMLIPILNVFQVIPHYNLNIMRNSQTLFDITGKVLFKIKAILEIEKPDFVLVHGDTSSAFAAALACYYMKIPVCHIEAGLRTYDHYSPYPEEFNRQAIDAMTNIFFAPTKAAKENLIREGRDEKSIYVTGNTVIDALKTTIHKKYSHEIFNWIGNDKLILLTAHRRENIGDAMRRVFLTINEVVNEFENVKVVYPVHLNPKVRKITQEIFKNADKIKLIEPLNIIDFHNLMNISYLIITDSGGIQEEAPSLGKPVLVIRNKTERPEGIEAGTLKLIGTEKENVKNAIIELLINQEMYQKMSMAQNPYGDGKASERIVKVLLSK